MIQRILVTGGAGFLGSHLCERLVEMGHDVIPQTDLPGVNNFGRVAAIKVDLKTGLMYSGSGPAWGTGTAGF